MLHSLQCSLRPAGWISAVMVAMVERDKALSGENRKWVEMWKGQG